MINFSGYEWETEMEHGRIINTGQPWMWYDKNAVLTSGNTAELNAYINPKVVHFWDGNDYYPTVATGLLRSVDVFGYGCFSAEIQLPKGENLWPSFWLVGSEDTWPGCGEIDIMEAWSNQLGYFRFGIPQPPYAIPSWDTTTNIHWQNDDGTHGFVGSRRLPLWYSLKNPTKNFIKHEVEWRKDIIIFKVNGKSVKTYGYDIARRLQGKKMHVLFNFWTTGENFKCMSTMKVKNFEHKPIEIM